MTQVFYDWSGGMESSAMLVVDRERIRETGAIVRWADTGKQFPEMAQSKAQIESILGIEIVTVPRRITFDEYLFERGGMIRKGTNDCSKKMKRSNLSRHMRTFEKPWEVNLGFNTDEIQRAEAFTDRNERPFCHWRFPLQEERINRPMTVKICEDAGFTVLVEMYRKMGRFDCFMCGNQKPSQALKVADNYPELAREWMAMEERKGHSFMPLPLKVLIENRDRQGLLQMEWSITGTLAAPSTGCGCFGGTENVFDE